MAVPEGAMGKFKEECARKSMRGSRVPKGSGVVGKAWKREGMQMSM